MSIEEKLAHSEVLVKSLREEREEREAREEKLSELESKLEAMESEMEYIRDSWIDPECGHPYLMSDEEREILDIVSDLTRAHARWSIGVMSEADEIRKLTDKLLEYNYEKPLY